MNEKNKIHQSSRKLKADLGHATLSLASGPPVVGCPAAAASRTGLNPSIMDSLVRTDHDYVKHYYKSMQGHQFIIVYATVEDLGMSALLGLSSRFGVQGAESLTTRPIRTHLTYGSCGKLTCSAHLPSSGDASRVIDHGLLKDC